MFEKFLEVLRKIKIDTKPLWGKMSAQHMVEHLILTIQMSNGKLLLDCVNPAEKLPALKRFLLSDRPLPKKFINPAIGKDLKPLIYSSLQTAINQLSTEIEEYNSFFQKYPDANPMNVTFGELNKEEWEIFHKKHFTHHLSQFGLL
ncbi:MAG: DUF1569 domain-containing protein [Ignavibacteria bacterium]|jgi:hypothetical protein